MKTAVLCAASVIALTGSAALSAPQKLTPGDWYNVGGDEGSTKFSTLSQITPANVTQLKTAWTYDTGDRGGGARGWEITPIVVNGIMYFPTSGGTVTALNADTGAVVWKNDLKTMGIKGNGSKYGVSYWPGNAQYAPRIVITTSGGQLVQFDAKTGAMWKKVGDNGIIDLAKGITEKFGGNYSPGTTPAIYKNIAILAPSTGEQGRYGVPGDPRAFDLITGKELWRFHTVPRPGEANFGDWGLNGWQDRHGPGTWVPMTVDTKRGIVYIALGNATDQNYGGNRPGHNSYATSTIALNAQTGALVWSHAETYHDIFDWDVNAPPTFVDVHKDGQTIPAVAQSTKNGILWILNRETGKAVFGEEDRPVAPSDAPGEKSSPVQPFPLKPDPIARIAMTRHEVSNVTPESHEACLKLYDTAVNEGPDTPYLMVPSIVFPSSEGGGGWGGASYDPQKHLIVVNTRSLGTMGVLQSSLSSGIFDSYAKRKIPFLDPHGYPCSAPPWGEIMAINADTGDFVWREPLGDNKELEAKGVPVTGLANDGAPVLTATGLAFIGSTPDATFRAIDTATGKVLWTTSMPNNAVDTGLTYQGKSGKQYVAVPVSTGLSDMAFPKSTSTANNLIMAWSLP
jgi:quinoprotein glucose dehydrogenase